MQQHIALPLIICLAALTTLLFAPFAQANKYEESPLDPIYQMVEAKQYSEAIAKLEAMLSDDAENADVLSLMGYSYRKQQQFDQALVYYQRALAIDPEHRAANEYLGQLYLETRQLDKAKERLAVLDSACFLPCREFSSLERAIMDYQE